MKRRGRRKPGDTGKPAMPGPQVPLKVTRRVVAQTLGNGLVLGALSACRSPSDGSSQQHGQNSNASGICTAAADVLRNTGADAPILMFVPGYTLWAGEFFNNVDKESYFAAQRESFQGQRGIIYMNEQGDFDSGHSTLQENANAIVQALRHVQDNDTRKVTIISHSKGGQDVLQALVQKDANGMLKNRDVWEVVSGWVAFTSNFFEGDFPIAGEGGGDTPPICTSLQTCHMPDEFCPPDICESDYADFDYTPGGKGAMRQQYMLNHEFEIRELMKCVATATTYATYVPAFGNTGALDLLNRGIHRESHDNKRCGANDGIVPARAARLPGALFEEKLRDDPCALNAFGNPKCGVDHNAPATDVRFAVNQFWLVDFRVGETARYINMVEGAPVAPAADAGSEQTVECESHAGSVVILDGSASTAFHRDIVTYEWHEAGEILAMSDQPIAEVTLALGEHEIELTVTDNCGASDTDIVTIFVQDTVPPDLLFNVATTTLWPPDHKLVRVAQDIDATDICDPDPQVMISISSNEPQDGLGDGSTSIDWLVETNQDGSKNIWLRAERSGNGTHRVYDIRVIATDSSGNQTEAQAQIVVPHDRRPSG